MSRHVDKLRLPRVDIGSDVAEARRIGERLGREAGDLVADAIGVPIRALRQERDELAAIVRGLAAADQPRTGYDGEDCALCGDYLPNGHDDPDCAYQLAREWAAAQEDAG